MANKNRKTRSRIVSGYYSPIETNTIARRTVSVVDKTINFVNKALAPTQPVVTPKPLTTPNPPQPLKITKQEDHSKYMPKVNNTSVGPKPTTTPKQVVNLTNNNQGKTYNATEVFNASPSTTVAQFSLNNPIQNKTVPPSVVAMSEATSEVVKEKPKKYPAIRTSFSDNTGTFVVNGTSVRGSSHITSNDPCQDYSMYENLSNGWAIAVTSDGAGSCKKSQQGSKANCIKAIQFFKEILTNYGWIENNYIPSELDWHMEASKVYERIYKDACKYAKAKCFNPQELSATIIVNIITPYGLLVSHIGDGRAGYLNGKDEWVSSIEPHKGEESNQTVFLHSNMHSKVGFKMSGVYVPECRVIVDEVKAFTLMSDGCEKSTWICSVFENEMFSDPNKPHAPFFNNVIKHLKETDTPNQDLSEILMGGTAAFKKETDDKTIIIGYKK